MELPNEKVKRFMGRKIIELLVFFIMVLIIVSLATQSINLSNSNLIYKSEYLKQLNITNSLKMNYTRAESNFMSCESNFTKTVP